MSGTIPGAAQFDGQRVAVFGLGISGRAAIAALLEHTHTTVSAWDARSEAVAPYQKDARIERAYSHPEAAMLVDHLLAWNPDLVVITPALRERGTEWAALRAAGVPVWSEIELAWHLRAARADGSFAPWLAVTGTNGKTTTTSMLAAMLRQAGLGKEALGNIGKAVVSAVSDTSESAPKAFALELSSFQLFATYSMQPLAAVCLNLAPDHLEWHESFESYRSAKAHIYHGVQAACVYPVGDTAVQAMVDEADVCEGVRAIGVTLGIPQVGQIGIVDGSVVDRAFHPRRQSEAYELYPLSVLAHLAPDGAQLPVHIVQDALAATALARAAGISGDDIRQALQNFAPGHHRIEYVRTLAGVTYVDDSKATNPHAAQASVMANPDQSVVWIAGGQPKGVDFTQLVETISPKLRAVVVIGVDQEPLRRALADIAAPVVYISAESEQPMREAVLKARAFAHAGDTVLLAPASASMDQFTSYAHRGEVFAAEVQALADKKPESRGNERQ
ncbi:MAG: UDP-N-acetylmuramoyl-L-alanine--D-glutamate ligase [Actinomycetaceae bacterium]|nr:UDP-N-acetylmuramoyl-L-alanine--D-glutamate ligase [Actinomycetaceae bacterium]MDY5853926.1 UDP-N-acetylmuramoyl-L-alanine--D-glutamate ligase [Arcanobacterium sp.]